jgi:hypothetical protein
MEYKSVNEHNDIPEHVVEELNRVHASDTGIFMGDNWPPENEETEAGWADATD